MWIPFFRPTATGPVTQNVYAARMGIVSMFLYADAGYTIAIDAGIAQRRVLKELQQLMIDPGSVTHLFLTHSDYDHAGGIGLFKHARLFLSRDEEQMIDGTTARLLRVYRNQPIDRSYELLSDGDVLTVGTIQVRAIATPGHTPGSMSYLVNDSVLFTADTLALSHGLAHPFYRLISMDPASQRDSLRKLARLRSVDWLCTSHTGCTPDFAGAMTNWRA